MVAAKEDGRVKSVFYVNAKVNEMLFPGQVEISGTAGENGTYAEAVGEFFNEVAAEPEEGQIVFILPRTIGGPSVASNGAQPAAAAPAGPPPALSGQNCPVHNTPFQQKHGKFGYFESCGQKNQDDSWCKMKPNKA